MFWRKKKKKKVEKTSTPKPDFDESFKVAFGLVISEIEGADDIPVASLFNAVSAHHGDTRNQTKALLECLKGSDWKWPVYESYTRGKQDVIYEAKVSDIEGYEPDELLGNFTVSRLKEVYSQCLGEKPKSSLRKQEIIREIIKVANHDLLLSLRREIIVGLNDPSVIDKKSMAEALARRIDALAYSLHRKQQMLEVAERRPYWEFMTLMDSSTPAECKSLHGTIKHYTDPFWQEHYPPCWRPDCGC
ncbi:MAG: hypothetical protein HWN68_01425 [Desulfobacterales bacterium]|nr:hypothetical protein [Desulfobacterales bacterium]